MFNETLDNLGQRNLCFPSPFPLPFSPLTDLVHVPLA
jgi:hypothetical protein